MWQIHKVSKCCWNDGTDLFVWQRVATNLFVKNATSVKQNKAKCDEASHARTGLAPFSWRHFVSIVSLETREAAQSCETLCCPMDCSLPGSSVHGIFLARVLDWVAILFSRKSSWPGDQTKVSCTAGRRFTFWATREAPLWRNYVHNTVIFWSYWLLGLQRMHSRKTNPAH